MKTEEKTLAKISLPLSVGEAAAALQSLQGVFPEARVDKTYDGLALIVDEEVADEEEPATSEPNADATQPAHDF